MEQDLVLAIKETMEPKIKFIVFFYLFYFLKQSVAIFTLMFLLVYCWRRIGVRSSITSVKQPLAVQGGSLWTPLLTLQTCLTGSVITNNNTNNDDGTEEKSGLLSDIL